MMDINQGIANEQPLKTTVKGVIDVVQFQSEIDYAQAISQLSYILIVYNNEVRDEVLRKVRTVVRLTDNMTIVTPGHIVILVHHQRDLAAAKIVVNKVKEAVGDIVEGVTGLFMPYNQLPLGTVFKHLKELSESSSEVSENVIQCSECNGVIQTKES